MAIQVFFQGNIYTGDGFVEAFAIDDGSFVMTGSNDKVLSAYPDSEKTDLHGSFVCAGFNDSHMHLVRAATQHARRILLDISVPKHYATQ